MTKEQGSTEAATGDDKPKDIAKRVVYTLSEHDDTNDFPKIVTSVSSDTNNTKGLPEGAAAAIRPSIAPTKTTNDNAEPNVKLELNPKKNFSKSLLGSM
ncbi:hypothetical protein GN244_ATG06104 [Phytophthora infestans]|uniref:Uncharacterized protein n=1 Tax=Phytophthora infestans TaxID=4787 RepID=A0A833S6D8_PHYIN|nr:hypothetical protein GN244_ATG06104 [Phytophthora infestans]KAF4135388.1 hypothetical protein GN958_ATG15410 [Phytophthora infestans]